MTAAGLPCSSVTRLPFGRDSLRGARRSSWHVSRGSRYFGGAPSTSMSRFSISRTISTCCASPPITKRMCEASAGY